MYIQNLSTMKADKSSKIQTYVPISWLLQILKYANDKNINGYYDW